MLYLNDESQLKVQLFQFLHFFSYIIVFVISNKALNLINSVKRQDVKFLGSTP